MSPTPHDLQGGDDDCDPVSPFEWLTSPASLKSVLDPSFLFGASNESSTRTKRTALHLGCGSSLLGEYLLREFNYGHVVNADIDNDVLERMKQRWQQQLLSVDADRETSIMDFVQIDLSCPKVVAEERHPVGYFDLVIDKSTLDCTLCSDKATTGLLCHAYQSLKRGGGYVVVSFHDPKLLLPLLENCPGTEWSIERFIMERQVEDLLATGQPKTGIEIETSAASPSRLVAVGGDKDGSDQQSVWCTGSFDPSCSENYRKFVNVIICRKNASATTHALKWDNVHQHIHDCNNEWFRSSNPMLTSRRQEDLRERWIKMEQQQFSQNNLLDLNTCYELLFTNAEREHLTFEYFLEDWSAFLETHSGATPQVSKDSMSFDTACLFLQEMQ